MANMAHLGPPQGDGRAGSVPVCFGSNDSFRSAEHRALQLASAAGLGGRFQGINLGSCLSGQSYVRTGPVEGERTNVHILPPPTGS